MVNVRVNSINAELDFVIQPSAKGKQLFDQVVNALGIREVWYFGLQYLDTKGYPAWLKLCKKVVSQDVKKDSTLQFKFLVKFYPEDVAQELIQEPTIRLFYLQTKQAILSDEIYCPPETSVILASYAVQAKHGDYEYVKQQVRFNWAQDRFIPKRVTNQHRITNAEWELQIITWWEAHHGMLKEDAMLEYLKIAQDLEIYGVNYFEIRNKKGSELWLGVDALGLSVYKKDDRMNPEVGFPWSEIRNVSFNDRKFTIKNMDKKCPDFVFYSPRMRVNKRILALCMGNHEMYQRRRKPDTLEIQQMKILAREEKLSKRKELEKLQHEVAARELAEKKQEEYEECLKKMEKDMEDRYTELMAAQDMIHQLEMQLKKLREAKELLEQRQSELEDMLYQLEINSELEAGERVQLEQEIRRKQDEVQRIQMQVLEKDEETQRLQRDLEDARRKQDRLAKNQHGRKSTTEFTETEETEHVNYEDWGNKRHIGHRLREQLKLLEKELARSRDEQLQTDLDKIYNMNIQQGRDKYKTLREIRRGNSKRRVDQFENM